MHTIDDLHKKNRSWFLTKETLYTSCLTKKILKETQNWVETV